MPSSRRDGYVIGSPRRRVVARPATIFDAVQWDTRSRVCGRTFRISVCKPADPPPRGGYPVVYVTDGNVCFGTAAMQARLVERAEGVSSALIVGIGYPEKGSEEYRRRRIHDFTFQEPTKKQKEELIASSQLGGVTYGGAEDLYLFITEELGLDLAELYDVDRANQALFGYSFGGLFVLHALLRYPCSFQTYVAASPAICWNDRALLGGLSEFRRMIEAGKATPRVLIMVGSREQSTEGLRIPTHMTKEQFDQRVNGARMIDNARELAEVLSTIEGRAGYRVAFHVFDGETHGSVIAASISRAISFAL